MFIKIKDVCVYTKVSFGIKFNVPVKPFFILFYSLDGIS